MKIKKYLFSTALVFLSIDFSQGATFNCRPGGNYTLPFKLIKNGGDLSVELRGVIYRVKVKKNFVTSDGYQVVYSEGEGIYVAMYPDGRVVIGSNESDKVITGGYCK